MVGRAEGSGRSVASEARTLCSQRGPCAGHLSGSWEGNWARRCGTARDRLGGGSGCDWLVGCRKHSSPPVTCGSLTDRRVERSEWPRELSDKSPLSLLLVVHHVLASLDKVRQGPLSLCPPLECLACDDQGCTQGIRAALGCRPRQRSRRPLGIPGGHGFLTASRSVHFPHMSLQTELSVLQTCLASSWRPHAARGKPAQFTLTCRSVTERAAVGAQSSDVSPRLPLPLTREYWMLCSPTSPTNTATPTAGHMRMDGRLRRLLRTHARYVEYRVMWCLQDSPSHSTSPTSLAQSPKTSSSPRARRRQTIWPSRALPVSTKTEKSTLSRPKQCVFPSCPARRVAHPTTGAQVCA